MATKSLSRPTKLPNNQTPPQPPPSSSTSTPPSTTSRSSPSLSSHFAMIELKQRILTSLSKLSDRDTHQIAVEDLHQIIQTLSPDGVSMLLNCLYDSTSDPTNKPSVKKESLRLLSHLCATHFDSTVTHLTKIIAHIVKRLKDSDSGVRDACRDAIGQLSSQYFKSGDTGGSAVVSLFAKPLFEAMNEQNKGVQGGSAMCMAKMVELATDPPVAAFSKLCPRICKYLNNPNFLAEAALLPVIASLSQVGAIAPQGLEGLLHSIHECLSSTDWATRKAAAETLNALALHSSNLLTEGNAASTLTVLETCRFDKIKPVRDSIAEALQIWKKIAGKEGDVASDGQKTSHDGESSEPSELSEKDIPNSAERKTETSPRDLSAKVSSISDKAAGMLKKVPALTDKEPNPEFFQRLETRGSGDLPVEVVVPRRCPKSSDPHNGEDDTEPIDMDARAKLRDNNQSADIFPYTRYHNLERGTGGASTRRRDSDDKNDQSQRESSAVRVGQSESFMGNKGGNWLAIQRQLLQLERQQAHLMNMLQDFMGGSHDGMVTLENRVRGLERVVEDMARDLSLSSGRRGANYMMGLEESSSRPHSKYNGFSDYPAGNSFIASGMRGRGPWRSDVSEAWDYHTYGRNGQSSSTRRTLPGDGRSPKSKNEGDNRRAWGDKGAGPIRFGEGPSARSVWQASKDEATLQAIRVAGEDNGPARTTRVAIPEMTAEALGDDNLAEDERGPVWAAWSNAMDALHAGDMDSAYSEVLSTGDDLLLVKIMDRTGPVIDQLSGEVGSEVLNAVAQFLVEQNLYDICLSWIQQLLDYTVENGNELLGVPMEVKRELLLNMHEASSTYDLPEDWEGITPNQLLLQLASVWEIDLQQLEK